MITNVQYFNSLTELRRRIHAPYRLSVLISLIVEYGRIYDVSAVTVLVVTSSYSHPSHTRINSKGEANEPARRSKALGTFAITGRTDRRHKSDMQARRLQSPGRIAPVLVLHAAQGLPRMDSARHRARLVSSCLRRNGQDHVESVFSTDIKGLTSPCVVMPVLFCWLGFSYL